MRYSECDKCKSINGVDGKAIKTIDDEKKVLVVKITTQDLADYLTCKSYDLCKKCTDDLLKQIEQYIGN